MDKNKIILQALMDLQAICLAPNSKELIAENELLIMSENNRYQIYSYELPSYLENNYSLTISEKEVNSILPDIIQGTGMRIQEMNQLPDLTFCCYKILLT